jgi:DNA-binding transcriptional LysR family regulator
MEEGIDRRAREVLVRTAVDAEAPAGDLHVPGDLTDENLSHYLVYPKGALRKPKVAAFRAWLLDEAAVASDAIAI